MISKTACVFVCSGLLAAFGCSDPTSSPGKGTTYFTTWGEQYIESRIPAGDGTTGVIDGWTVYFDKFLVNFHEIVVADAAGTVAAQLDKPRFADNVDYGAKELIKFENLDAKAYTQVGYQIKTAVPDEVIVDRADPADLAMMVQDGLSVYVAGEAMKRNPANPAEIWSKTFHWGFKAQTSYKDCHTVENGIATAGV